MSRTSELEMRILSELEEAGEENIAAMLNTIIQPIGDAGEVASLQQALKNLVRADFIRMSTDRDSAGKLRDLSAPESLEIIENLASGLHFDSETMFWANTRRSGPPFGDSFPYIVNTKTGRDKGFEILTERGYQWWRSNR